MIASTDRYVFALDPSRYGEDETVLAIRRGGVLLELLTWRERSTMETTGRVLQAIRDRGIEPVKDPESGQPEPFYWPDGGRMRARPLVLPWGIQLRRGELIVDSVGLGGGVVDRLAEQNVPVVEFNGGFSPTKKGADRYANARAESYFHLRQLLEKDAVAIPRDGLLWEELLTVQYVITSSGKVQLESKDLIKQRIGRSPDRADAVTMCFYEPDGIDRRNLDPAAYPALRG